MSAATPGPWKMDADNHLVADEHGRAIAFMAAGRMIYESQIIADAKLIAAASSLADALQRLLKEGAWTKARLDAMEQAHAALRLAGRLP